VGDSVCVNVMKSPDKLLGDFPDFFDFKALIVFNDVKKFALTEFCDQDELSWSLERIKEEDDVLMLEFFEDIDFLSHGLDIFLLFAFFLDGLDGYKLTSEFFSGFVDLTVGSLAYQRDDLIVLFFVLEGHFEKCILLESNTNSKSQNINLINK
jgi:hypothetical protein